MKINESRKSTHSIMGHQGFGGVLLKQNDVELYIPNEFLFKNGKLKKYAKNAWNQHKAKHTKVRHVG